MFSLDALLSLVNTLLCKMTASYLLMTRRKLTITRFFLEPSLEWVKFQNIIGLQYCRFDPWLGHFDPRLGTGIRYFDLYSGHFDP